MASNVETVQEIYEAFGRQDVPAILEHLAEDVEWDADLPEDGPPWLRPRRGRDQVPGFFQDLGENVEVKAFEPYSLLASENEVVSLIRIEFTVRKNGAKITDGSNAHLWRFDADGKVTSLRHLADTRQHHEAWQGTPSA